MSTQVEFLLLDRNSQWVATAFDSLTQLYADFERVLLVAADRKSLDQLDEILWHNSSEQFVPYSLDSECYSSTSAVLLTDKQPENFRYKALINDGGELPLNPQQFKYIVELVKADELSKEKARKGYQYYRQQGFLVSHKHITENC